MNSNRMKAILVAALMAMPTLATAAVWTSLNPSATAFSYGPNPANAIWYYNGNLTPQNDSSIRAEVENVFGLTAGSLFSVSKCDGATTGCTGASATETSNNGSTTNTFSSVNAFNYLAIHFGQAELVFQWINPITSFTFTDLNGPNGFVRGLSNYRAYGDISAIPVPAAAWLFASGLGLFGVARTRKPK